LRPVSPRVGNVKYNDLSLIEPIVLNANRPVNVRLGHWRQAVERAKVSR
jgi:hypothetical protein